MSNFPLHVPRFLRFGRFRSRSSNPSTPRLGDGPHQNTGMFNQTENFSATGNFIYNNGGNVTNNASSNQFMKELLEETIRGAESDSSDRDPPPRCHPGTRLAILERCLHFISTCNGIRKIRWVVGAAGVGKSAILQSVVESPELAVNYHTSVFFSINGRNQGGKTIMTLSYQFAAKSKPYRQVIEQEIMRDPSLLRSSIEKQFNKLIIEPFIRNPTLSSAGRVLVVIDGLDECHDDRMQLELLRLISDLCLMHPSSPLVWLIASRPEPHITSFFSKATVAPAYEKEEVPVNSDEARADVERFLRNKLAEIRDLSVSLDPQWPEERDFWRLADAAGGLFAYAQTAVRYIGDSKIGSPASQLSEVLHIVDEHPMTGVSREEHPMAQLDALYDRILSNVPAKIMVNTRKLLLALASGWDRYVSPFPSQGNFMVLCNWLGMTRDDAYAALNHLYSVLYVPPRDKAHAERLKPFHKSFLDYIFDFTRSGFSSDIEHEGRQLMTQCALRVLKEAPDGVHFRNSALDYGLYYGALARGPGTGDGISLTWLADEAAGWDDDETRLTICKLAIAEVVSGIKRGDPTFLTVHFIRLVISRFEAYSGYFPVYKLRDFVFDEFRRPEFMTSGLLKPAPLAIVNIYELDDTVKLHFRHPISTAVEDFSDPWNTSCLHEREGEWEEGKNQEWRTAFEYKSCYCSQRLEQQLESWQTRSPNHEVLILFTSTPDCCVEFRFVDPKDGISEWTYWFWCKTRSRGVKSLGLLYDIRSIHISSIAG